MRIYNKNKLSVLAVALCGVIFLAPMLSFLSLGPNDGVLQAQANLKQPSVTQQSALKVQWTAGTLNNGGHAVTITAGSVSVNASQTDCSAPGYASCNFLYASSGGTVTLTTSVSTARATGNSLMAYVETSGSAITKLSFPAQASTVTLPSIGATLCAISSNTCTNTNEGGSFRQFYGSAALTLGAVTIAGFSPAFTSTSTFGCTATVNGNTNALALTVRIVGNSTITINSTGYVSTDTVFYTCVGI